MIDIQLKELSSLLEKLDKLEFEVDAVKSELNRSRRELVTVQNRCQEQKQVIDEAVTLIQSKETEMKSVNRRELSATKSDQDETSILRVELTKKEEYMLLITAELKDRERDVESLQRELESREKESAAIQRRMKDLEAQIQALRDELENQKVGLACIHGVNWLGLFECPVFLLFEFSMYV